MRKTTAALAGALLTLGLVGCTGDESAGPAAITSVITSTASPASTTTTASDTTTTTQTVVEEPVPQETAGDPPAAGQPRVAPEAPPFMNPEDFDPYGPPRFVECWESNAAVMSDGSIVTDTVNCAPSPAAQDYTGEAPRADGCVGPAAVCGYYDEHGNPIWLDKMTGETSPRYYDEHGNPTMEAP